MKTVFITGVGKGLGKALFLMLLQKGYNVTGLVRKKEDVDNLTPHLGPNGRIILGDVSLDEVMEIGKQVQGPVDLLINNAGISGKGVTIRESDPSFINKVFNVHCTGALRIVKALEPNLLLSEDPVIVNISSRMGSLQGQSSGTYERLEVSYSYRIAKAAQNMLTNCLRREFRSRIKCIALHPGKMKTQKAQTDADMEPEESARLLVDAWEQGTLSEVNGILELPGKILPW